MFKKAHLTTSITNKALQVTDVLYCSKLEDKMLDFTKKEPDIHHLECEPELFLSVALFRLHFFFLFACVYICVWEWGDSLSRGSGVFLSVLVFAKPTSLIKKYKFINTQVHNQSLRKTSTYCGA